MKVFQLDDMIKGWFIGNFAPTVLSTNSFEVAVKKYKAGDYEPIHHHRKATEITVIIDGQVKMNGSIYIAGSIIVIDPFQETDFLALTDVTTTVIKYPSANNDKYLRDQNY
jgi:hypothetical protein